MSKIYETRIVKYFVLKAHYARILSLLHQSDFTATELTKLIDKTRPTILKQICILESEGLVSRYVLDKDKRKKYFCTTPEGVRQLDSFLEKQEEVVL